MQFDYTFIDIANILRHLSKTDQLNCFSVVNKSKQPESVVCSVKKERLYMSQKS